MLDLNEIDIKKISDNDYIRLNYYKCFNKWPNENNPKTFCEKIHRIKISDWLYDKSIYVDKYKVREYIRETIGNEYLTKLYDVYKNIEEINFDKLPKSFVLKLNNGSGYNLIVKNKNEIDKENILSEISKWFSSNYYKRGREKQYKNIKHVVLCEEYLEDNNSELNDYKLFCFDGKFKFVQVDSNRFTEHTQNFYDSEWNKLDFTYARKKNNFLDKRPINYKKMIEIAETLSSEFPFVRVDLYNIDSQIYFGELTFTPNNGRVEIKPHSKDIEIAIFINLNKYI